MIYTYDLPQKCVHHNMLSSLTNLKIKDGLCVLYDPKCENHIAYMKVWVYFLKKVGIKFI